MKTDTTKFLAVLAVFAMAFAGFATVTVSEENDASSAQDNIVAMINMAKANGAVDLTPDSNGDVTVTLKADGYIYSGSTTTSLGKWENGFYNESGGITATIDNGATIVINGTACGIAAIGAITITASEKVALTVNVTEVTANVDEDERAGGIIATGAISIKNVALKVSCNASASLATGAGSYGLYSASTLTLTNCSGTVFGGSMGAYAVGKIEINGGDWTVAGYERGLRSYANVEIGTSTATTLTANIIDGDGANGAGCDARFGVKTAGTLIVGKSTDATVKSTLETMGLYTKNAVSPVAGSKIIVQGGYEQTKAPGATELINATVGFACEAATTVTENDYLEHIASADKATAGKISIVEGAEVYNYLIPEYSAEYDAKDAADAAAINTAISSATYKDNSVVYVDLTSNSTITSLEGLEIPAGKTVIIEPKTDVEYYGTITLASSTSVVKLVGMKLEETAATGILKIVGGTGSEVTIAPAASGTTVSATIGYGSVVIKDISVSGATTLNVTVSGDVKIIGTVGTGATVNIIKAADKTADVIISKELYNSGTIIFGEVTLTAEKEITNYGTFTFDEKTVIGSQITIIGGNVQGTIDGSTLILKGEVNASGNITVNGKMTIAEGAKLTLDSTDKLTINENAKLNVYGKIILSVNTASVENNGTIYVLSKDAVIPDKISGTGTIEFEAIEEIVELKGNLRDATFHQYQAVYITGDSSIVENSKVVVNGKITVNPGVTLTITDGSYLAVLNSYGKIVNYGKIVVLAGAEAAPTYNEIGITGEGLIVSNATFENYGEIQFDYTPATGTTALYSGSFMDQANVLNYGDITIFESNIVDLGKTAIAKFVNYADATLTINGQIDFSAVHTMKTITNYGAVVVNGILETTDDIVIDQVANGATVLVTNLAGDAAVGKLTITDAGIDAVTKKAFAGHNSIVITDATVKDSFSGLMVTTTTKMGSTANYVYMDIAGALDAENSADNADAKVELSGDYVTMNTIMTMTKEITLTGKLTVNGLMTLEDGSKYNTSGAVTVYGALISGIKPIDPAITVNAAMFVTGTTTEKTYTYTTLDKAIAGAEEEDVNLVTATGNVAVTESIEIPAGMTVKQLSGVITIGSATNNSVVLTVDEGAKIDQTAGNILVYGTLFVENKNTGIKKSPSVTADVKEESATALIYTNLVYALSITPTEPTTVTLFNNVEVTTDITIPEFVTLDTNGKDFKIKGATLTIDGMLYLNGGTYSVDDVPGTIVKEGKVVLNGYIKNADFMSYDKSVKKYPAGAYFSVSDSGTFYYITPVSIAASCAMIADDNTISIYGKNTVGAVSFEGTETEPVFVNVNGQIASGTFELSFATMTIAAGTDINMTVGCSTGSIAFKNAKADEKTVISASVVLTVPLITMTSGSITNGTGVEATKYNTTFDGDVILKSATIEKGVIDGTTVVTGTVKFTGKTVVNDTLSVSNACALTMEDVTVYGNLNAADATSTKSAGSIVISDTLTAGDNEYAGSDAVISGNVTATTYIVYDGTTFEGKVSETIADLMDEGQYTEFYVLDELWFTYIYSGAQPDVLIKTYEPKGLEDSKFSNWQFLDKAGELQDIEDTDVIGDHTEVYALIDYEIYTVSIITDSGIKSIAIKGIQMEYENNVFFMAGLTAGTYKVTYTLKSGYEGTAVLSTMTGTILKDNSFTLSGTDPDDLEVAFQLAGTEPIPEPEPTPTPTPEEKSEWTVTTILLCILVVLIAIMAVIVALRLNRN